MNGVVIVVYLAIIVLIVAGFWRVFTKAGEAGWKAIIPIWNLIVLLRIAGRPVWWIILLIIPLVNIIVYLVVMLDLAKSSGRAAGLESGSGSSASSSSRSSASAAPPTNVLRPPRSESIPGLLGGWRCRYQQSEGEPR